MADSLEAPDRKLVVTLGEQCSLRKVPGYLTRKPIEIDVFQCEAGYIATHNTPSDTNPNGGVICAIGLSRKMQ